jgi:hypothetical protein
MAENRKCNRTSQIKLQSGTQKGYHNSFEEVNQLISNFILAPVIDPASTVTGNVYDNGMLIPYP